jgi:hypothetical protein
VPCSLVDLRLSRFIPSCANGAKPTEHQGNGRYKDIQHGIALPAVGSECKIERVLAEVLASAVLIVHVNFALPDCARAKARAPERTMTAYPGTPTLFRRSSACNTGDGIVQVGPHELRTAPLWGVRAKVRLLHDLRSLSLEDGIIRHDGEAREPAQLFRELSPEDREALITFLRTL